MEKRMLLRKIYKKIWQTFLVLLLLAGIIAACVYCKWMGVISDVDIKKTKNGWICEGPIQCGLRYPLTRPVVSGKAIVILEMYRNPLSLRSFPRDFYYISALSLSDGDFLYRRKLGIEGNPLQVRVMLPWKDNIVIWGYYQEEAGLSNEIFHLMVLNTQGRIQTLANFGIARPRAIDEKNGFILCDIIIYDLKSDTIKSRKKFEGTIDISADKKGNMYLLRRDCSEEVKQKEWRYYVEKYSTEPLKKLWSAPMSIPKKEKRTLVMLRYDNELIWYADYDQKRGDSFRDSIKWLDKPLDSKTGLTVEPSYEFDPSQIVVEEGDKKYKVSMQEGKICVVTNFLKDP